MIYIKKRIEFKGISQIVFFDGYCGLCNFFVNLLLDIDKENVLKFAPLQGQKAAELLPNDLTEKLSTLVFIENEKIYTESDAVLRILYSIGGIWKLFYVFILVPKFIRNAVYAFVSKHRIRWFGSINQCRFPTKEEKIKFLD
jgi:predicted DCC family thiol-disulfide oxidoreductase YuxK